MATPPPFALDPLPYRTPAAWAEAQRPHVDELLLEQAHLEKKAAAGALSLSFRLPAQLGRQRALSALAREELVHFERTLRLLERRGLAFAPQASSGYAERLKRAIGRDLPQRLVDELLVASIIEARSHERMDLLARALRDTEPEVADFYAELCEAEARHESLYAELAASVLPPDAVAARHKQLGIYEAEQLRTLPFAPRLHSGAPAAVAERDGSDGVRSERAFG